MNKKPRILLITPLPPPVHGASMVSQRIKESQTLSNEFDMDFINLSTSHKVDEIQKKSLPLYLVKSWRFLGIFLKTIIYLSTRKYDLCYLAITCYGLPFLKDFPLVMLCKLFCHRIVIHQHNKGMSRYCRRWPYKWLMPMAYRNTSVMLLSQLLYPDIELIVQREQVIICPNGIPATTSSPLEKELPETTPHLLFLSNLLTTKGVFILLDALQLLKEKGVGFHCDFVGGTSKEIDAKVFKEAVQSRGLQSVVTYHGPKYGDEKNFFWAQASAFVLPTYDECFPLVILEAMQHHLPVITTDEGGIPDIVADGGTGFICNRKDARALAKTIECLLNDTGLAQEMGEAGYQRYNKLFTLNNFEENFAKCLHNVIKQRM